MEKINPFSLSFGKEPQSIIHRGGEVDEVLEAFEQDPPSLQVCMITGLRGSGKTVAMSSMANRLRGEKDWVVVDLNSERDMLQGLAAELSNRKELFQLFRDAKINLSVLGFGLEIDGVPPITDVAVALDRMLERLTKKGKRVLVTVDEATNSKTMREFASQFQIFMRKNYAVFFLMTGLYENIYDLQNEKTLTFLYRAPKIDMKPLNLSLIASNYQSILNVSTEESIEMAKLTQGYSYAYQVLGYLCFKNHTSFLDVLPEFDMYLSEYVYAKLWSELSPKDQEVMRGMSRAADARVETIRRETNMDSNTFTVYRKRLLDKGIVQAPSYGQLTFVLPRFSEFIQINSIS